MTLYTTTPRSLDAFVGDLQVALGDMLPDATLADVAEEMELGVEQLVDLLSRAVASGRAATALQCTASTQVAQVGLEAF